MTGHKNLELLSQRELDELITRAETAKIQVRERRRGELKVEFTEKAKAEGFTLPEVVRARSRASQTPRYVHPQDASLSWTGIGRQPKWLTDLAGEGGTIDAFRVGE